MRLDTVVLAVSAFLLATAPSAHSAQIGPAGRPACLLQLEGPIEAGDGDKLSAALDALGSTGGYDSRQVSLCLSSLGGSYDEALKMIKVLLKQTNIATVVDRGAECYSACAFLFLAGNTQASEDGELAPDRTMDVGATLGFHAPYLPTPMASGDIAAIAETYRSGVLAIAKLLEIDARELFPRGLLGKALQVGPNELLYIDTVEKAGVWKIKLKGFKPPAALTGRMLDQACRSNDLWSNFSHSILGRAPDDPDTLHGFRQTDFPEIRGTDEPIRLTEGKYRASLDLFGYEATNKCIVDVVAGPGNELYLSLSMLPFEQPIRSRSS
ncbi:MAG: hypothetical protein WDN31_07475 [Hyphomicrobium sp.]